MRIISEKNQEKLFSKVADIIEASIGEILKEKKIIVFGVPGGRSMPGIFSELTRRNIDWERIHIFMVDERMVPIDDQQSNFKLAKEYLIDRLKIPSSNVHPFVLEKGINAYSQELKKVGGFYDIMLLSAGEDGHVGALYPNHHSIRDDSEYFIQMNDSPKLPPKRMSCSRKLLMSTKVAILLFMGVAKKDAFEKFKNNAEVNELPASMVRSIKDSYVFTDLV